jgi:hypothetical protein
VLSTLARRAVLVAAAPLMMLAFAPSVTLARDPSATIHLQNQARLQSNGSALVTVAYSCSSSAAGTAGNLFVFATQPPRYAFAFAPATCNGQQQTATIAVTPGPLHAGTATAFAQVASLGLAFAQTNAQLTIK